MFYIEMHRQTRSNFKLSQSSPDEMGSREKIATGLVSFVDKRSAGRPISRPATPTTPPPPAPGHHAKHPADDIRYDGLHHYAIMLENSQKRNCKFCKKSKTQFFCEKCNLHLCITKDKNCHKAYHTKP